MAPISFGSFDSHHRFFEYPVKTIINRYGFSYIESCAYQWVHILLCNSLFIFGDKYDHVHVFFGIRHNYDLSKLVWVSERKWILFNSQVLVTVVNCWIEWTETRLIGARCPNRLKALNLKCIYMRKCWIAENWRIYGHYVFSPQICNALVDVRIDQYLWLR